ncbi:MAG: hypothetical protein ACYSUN_09245 [Planctomycetota bacterium]|jgi:hypothetical protein
MAAAAATPAAGRTQSGTLTDREKKSHRDHAQEHGRHAEQDEGQSPAEAQPLAKASPALEKVGTTARRVVERGEDRDVDPASAGKTGEALLEVRRKGHGLFAARLAEEGIHQLGHPAGEDRVLVVLQTERGEQAIGVARHTRAGPGAVACDEVEHRVEVVVGDEQGAAIGMAFVVLGDRPPHHEAQGGLARALLPEDDRGLGAIDAAEDLGELRVRAPVPTGQALEDRVVPRLLGPEGIFRDSVVGEKSFDVHGTPGSGSPTSLRGRAPSIGALGMLGTCRG